MHRLDQITNTGERGSLKPGCLVTRRNYAGYEPLLLLREPTACTLYHMIVIKKVTSRVRCTGAGSVSSSLSLMSGPLSCHTTAWVGAIAARSYYSVWSD